jgi:hypothetical protein
MLLSFIIATIAFLFLVWHSRRDGASLGLPIAYLFSLLFQHLPGGLAHLVGGHFFTDSSATEIGLRFTAIGTVAFVIGVVFAQRASIKPERIIFEQARRGSLRMEDYHALGFARLCFLGGMALVALASVLKRIPSLGAAVDQAASIWILGVLVGLLVTTKYRLWGKMFLWMVALAIYPTVVLINAGFLSFGTTSIFVVTAALLVSVRSDLRAYIGLGLFSLICFLGFLSYFQSRNGIRESLGAGAPLVERIQWSSSIFMDIRFFDPANNQQLDALDQRLNQNYFAGAAAQRIEAGHVQFLSGRSVAEGLQALIPRAIWPDKPIFAGSSEMIREMSGFIVNDNTSFGVGQVMEFYINFGILSLIIGFALFGLAYGWMDHMAAMALRNQDYGGVFIWFLPCISMLSPLASIAEIMGKVASAFVAAYGWRWLWRNWESRQGRSLGLTKARKDVSGRNPQWQDRIAGSTE